MGGMRGWEILLIVVAIIVLFGASRLPQLGSSIGSFVKNLKKGLSGDADPDEKKLAETTGQQVQPAEKSAQKQSS